MRTIVKFFPNPQEDQREAIPFISRTMCKLAIVSKDYKGIEQLPQEPTFFWVRIQQETFARGRPASQSGCFVVEPLEVVKDNAIMRLLPGMFRCTATEGIVIIRPTQSVDLPWIIPLNLRKKLAKEHAAHAVIVDLSPQAPATLAPPVPAE